MRKNLVLNFTVLNDFNISVEDLLFLYNLFEEKEVNIANIDLQKLQREKLIKIITDEEKTKYILREKSVELLEFLTVEIPDALEPSKKTTKRSQRTINQEIDGRIELFRDKWKGLKAGSMGSPKSCEIKLTRWMKENSKYTFDDILKAVDIYIDSLHGDYRFLQRADYFIFKQENNREESSRLSAYIEEIGLPSRDEWTSKLN